MRAPSSAHATTPKPADPRELFPDKTVFFPPPETAEKLGAYETCGMCHLDIYNDWQTSMHAQGWTSPLFQAIYEAWYKDDPNVVDCRTCHAPSAVSLKGYGFEPDVTAGDLNDGVTCVSCHLGAHGEVFGPRGSQDSPHPAVKSDVLISVQMCDSCHGIEGDELLDNMKREYEETGLEAEGVTCQSCHMPLTERALYNGGEETSVHRHTFQGGHDAVWLQGVVALDASLLSTGIEVTVTNQKTGHNFPAGCIWRRVKVETRFIAADGTEESWLEVYSTESRRVLVRNTPEILRYPIEVKPGRIEVDVTYRSVDEDRASQLGAEIEEMFGDKPVSSAVYEIVALEDGTFALELVSKDDQPDDLDAYPMPPELDPWRP